MSELSERLKGNCGFFERVNEGYLSTRAGCCSGTKYPGQIRVYIPVEWTEAFGHDINIIKQWLEVVEEALGHRTIKLVENLEGEYIHEYPIRQVTTAICKKSPYYSHYEGEVYNNADHSNIERNEFYKLIIPAGTSYQNYFTFVLLRHLWNYHYVPIVSKVFEIKPQLTISDNKSLTAILMAYAEKDYAAYYGVCHPEARWKYKYVNPEFNKETSSLNYGFMNTYDYPNSSRYTNHTMRETAKFQELLKAQDWGGLEQALFLEERKRFPGKDDVKEKVVKAAEPVEIKVIEPVVVAVQEEIAEVTQPRYPAKTSGLFEQAEAAIERGRVITKRTVKSKDGFFKGLWDEDDKAVSKESVAVEPIKIKAKFKGTVKRKLRVKKAEEAIIVEVPKKKLLKKKKKVVTPVVEGTVPVKKKIKKLKRKTVI